MSRPRAVLVTGGTVRLGKAIAGHLREHGWRVLTSSHRPDAGADLVADLSDLGSVARLFDDAVRLAPDLCAVVNNAALYEDAPEALVAAVDHRAPVCLTTLLGGREQPADFDGSAPRFRAVVNILDARLFADGPVPAPGSRRFAALSPYLRAKASLYHDTMRYAALMAQSLRVNAVAPGGVLAPVAVRERAVESLLPYRPAPVDVAHAVRFLLENENVTGCCVPVDSGFALASGRAAAAG